MSAAGAAAAWPLAPMKAGSGALPHGSDWVYEPKWDGHRALIRLRPATGGDAGSWGRLDVVSSTGKPRTEQWPFIAAELPALVTVAPSGRAVGDGSTILDGEVIAYGDDGRHSFGLVGRTDRRHALVLFDVLRLDGLDLTGRPWHERRELLEHRVRAGGSVQITPVTDDAEAMEAATRAQRFEGVIAKRRDSLYLPGRRTPAWFKVKWRLEQEFVVGGYKVGEGNRDRTFGSLLLGVRPRRGDSNLVFAGAVGTGFTEATLSSINQRLRALTVDTCPFTAVPVLPGGRGRLRWVRPELVAQVAFGEWTDAGILRHPAFLGLRDDKDPGDVVRET